MQQFISQFRAPGSSAAVRQNALTGLANALAARPALLERIWRRIVIDFNEEELPEGYMSPQDLIETLITEVLTKQTTKNGQTNFIFRAYSTEGQFASFAVTVLKRTLMTQVRQRRPSRGQSSLRAGPAAAPTKSLEQLENEVFVHTFEDAFVDALQSNTQMTPVDQLVFCYVERGKRPPKRKRRQPRPASSNNTAVLLGLLKEKALLQICTKAIPSARTAAKVLTLMYPDKIGTETDLAKALGLKPADVNRIKTNSTLKQAFQASVKAAQEKTKQQARSYAANTFVP